MSIKTKIAIAKPFEGKPQINLPSIIGASSKKPILVRIATTGQRPNKYEAINLPNGMSLKENIKHQGNLLIEIPSQTSKIIKSTA